MLLKLTSDNTLLLSDGIGIRGIKLNGEEWTVLKDKFLHAERDDLIFVAKSSLNPTHPDNVKDLMECQESTTHLIYTTSKGIAFMRDCGIEV